MPNLLAHYLLAKRFSIRESEIALKNPNFNSFLEGNFDYFSLGTQGPDPLFFMGILPFHLHLPTAMKKIGNQLHKSDGKRFFRFLIEQCYAIEPGKYNNKSLNQFMAFVFGQYAHYLLDREAHPYILYESGFDKNGKITGKYHYSHASFESKIDFCLAKKYKMEYFLKKPTDILVDHKSALKLVDIYFVPVLKRMFDFERLPKDMYSNGMHNYKSILSYTNSGSEMRIALVKKTNLGASRLPLEVKEDVLNESRELWLDPVSGKEHHESFLELHSRAYDILEETYLDIIRQGFNYDTFAKYLDGRNYYGTPCKEKWIYKKEEEN